MIRSTLVTILKYCIEIVLETVYALAHFAAEFKAACKAPLTYGVFSSLARRMIRNWSLQKAVVLFERILVKAG